MSQSNAKIHFIEIDNALSSYYQRFGHLNYRNSDGIGIFLQFINDEKLDNTNKNISIENVLGDGCNPNDCIYQMAWSNTSFPIPDHVNIDNHKRNAFIFYILQYCYYHQTAPTNQYIKGILIPKIEASILEKQSQRKSAECEYKSHVNTNYIHQQLSCSYRSYEPKSNGKYVIRIPRSMTTKIISSRITEQIQDIYSYMIKMIALQHDPVTIIDNVWILYFDFHDNKTKEPLYCIADRCDKTNYGYKWKLRHKLYTVKEICNLTKLSINKLPKTIINTTKYRKEMQNVYAMKQIVNDLNKRKQIFSTHKPWQNVIIFKNEKEEINELQRKLGMRKPDFLIKCKDAVNNLNDIKLIPILLFNHKSINGYAIDGLVILKMDDNTNIGISFKYNENTKVIMPSGIHLDVECMQIHCQLANPQQSTAICQYFDKWTSSINDLFIVNQINNGLKYKYDKKHKNEILNIINDWNKKSDNSQSPHPQIIHEQKSENTPTHLLYTDNDDDDDDEYKNDNIGDKCFIYSSDKEEMKMYTICKKKDDNENWKCLLNDDSPSLSTTSISSSDEETQSNSSCDEYNICTETAKHNDAKSNINNKRLLSNEYSVIYDNYAIYDGPSATRAQGNIQISRNVMESIIPKLITENLSNLFLYMDKCTVLQNKYEYNDGRIRIINYDFHDIKSNDILYCIAERQNESNNGGYKWKMRDKLFTNKDIQRIYHIEMNKLPKSIRSCDEFNCNNDQLIMNKINKKSIAINIVNNTKWRKIPIYSKEPNRRKERVKLSINVEEFRKKMIYFIDIDNINKEKNKILPIVMFKNNKYCIQYIWIVTIKTEIVSTDIAVALEYNKETDNIIPVGIHLDQQNIIINRQLLDPTASNNDLKDFESHYDDIRIGNVDEHKNLIKARQDEINRLKEIIKQMTNKNNSPSPILSYVAQPITSASSLEED